MKKLLILSFLMFSMLSSKAQNNRVGEKNTIAWISYFGTFKLSPQWGIHTEYQFRRTNFVNSWQQGLLRLGANYNLSPKAQLRLGYAWVETYPYGETPINSFGKQFTEHRTFQMLTLNDNASKLSFAHRFMLEQRWLGRYAAATDTKISEFLFANRLRYMFRTQLNFTKPNKQASKFYAAIYDEVFIGFGKNVGQNIFDQNRLGILLGCNLNKHIRLEGGYLSQIVQLGRLVNNKNIFQYNSGLIVSNVFTFGK